MSSQSNLKASKKLWHVGFFAGAIGLNLLIFFRAAAFKVGGWPRAIWTAIVVATGALMLLCLYKIRTERMAKEEARHVEIESSLPSPSPSKYGKRKRSTSRLARGKKKKSRNKSSR